LAWEMSSRIPRTRIESLTDLIFGLALSIGSLSLLARAPATPEDVMLDIVEFGFSFLILISIWFRYSNIMSILPFETGGIMVLNAVMLFLVSIEPYLLSLLTFGPLQASRTGVLGFASEAYALDIAGLNLIMGLFTQKLVAEERPLVGPDKLSTYRRIRNTEYIVAAAFAVSIAPIFWSWQVDGTPVRFYLWYAILGLIWVSRFSRRIAKRGGAEPTS